MACIRQRFQYLTGGLSIFLLCGLVSVGSVQPGRADGERAGAFDYYVMALSWNASWCAREGDARGADQCESRHDLGWTLHGLWPQSEQGWPSFCRTGKRDPARAATADMADIMGSGGLAWYQWKKHGRCSALSAADYFRLSREAYGRVVRPDAFRRLPREFRFSPGVVEEAFLEANPNLTADGVTVTCRDGYVQEVRVCLTRDLTPRACAPDTRRDCTARMARFPPMR